MPESAAPPPEAPDPHTSGAAPQVLRGKALRLWWLTVPGLLLAVVLLVTENLRAYGYAVGATLGVLALIRAILPESQAGGLVVRSRAMDVLTLLGLGTAIAVLAANLRIL